MADSAEILIDDTLTERGRRLLKKMSACAPDGSEARETYTGRHRILVVWGGGRPDRVELLKRHRADGGVTVAWDLAYWDREGAARMGINSLHPTAAQLAKAPDGPGRREFVLREDADPDGPVLLVGLGRKSARMLGVAPMWWETKRMKALQQRFPGRPIKWRPKGRDRTWLTGAATMCVDMAIEDALRGCSLVVCRHSNVAVDACVAGVPVECEDGAAAALYAGNPAPTREQRAEFLRRLTWWEWRPDEAPQAWDWIARVIECV